MALFMKQDFTPPVLSRKWIVMKFRPNMLVNSHHHIVSILESGLLFREDSISVQQECPELAGPVGGAWFTRGERAAAVLAVAVGLLAFPPTSLRRSCVSCVACVSAPWALRACLRRAARGSLPALLALMRQYLALARRAAACVKECATLRAELDSVSSVLESTHAMLCRQQSSLCVVMSRASSAILGNAPWLHGDVAWDAVATENDNLLKIHHAFLVVQSTLLKHIAMAHYVLPPNARRFYKNHNERLYWIHNTLIEHLNEEFKENYDSLDRMYRLLKNYGNNDCSVKKPGAAVNDSWLCSEVHTGVARANLELKSALNKCNNLDMFLDSCALNNQELDLDILNRDMDNLIDDLTKCLKTVQNSQIRLKKLQSKFSEHEEKVGEDVIEDDRQVLMIEDKEPEARDEVFYFVKTEDDSVAQPIGDISTGPGKKEKEATKIVLNELRRKLVRREDVMRERERQALVKTMPELKDNVPEFPRQINVETERKGFISKLNRRPIKKRLFRQYKIRSPKPEIKFKKYKLKTNKYTMETDIDMPFFEANANFNARSRFVSFFKNKYTAVVTKWCKSVQTDKTFDSSGLSDGLSDVEAATVNKTVNHAVNIHKIHDNSTLNHAANSQKSHDNGEARNYRFSKRELELSPSSSDTDELYKEKQLALLKDVRRHRAARRKNYPDKRASLTLDRSIDEGLRPVEYSLGATLSMAAVLRAGRAPPPPPAEDVFAGSGELELDSGNDEDA